jgi:aspartate aminotransferase-like enzyme
MKLLSPGPVPSETIEFSHRSDEFRDVYKQTALLLLNLSGYKNVIFTQGSASSAVETVLSSTLAEDTTVAVVVNGEFGRRAAITASYYSKNVKIYDDLAKVEKRDVCFVVQFETSNSYYNDLTNFKFDGKLIVDAVSAFPYYPIPQADFLIVSSSKQLSGLPAMGIVLYNDLPALFCRSDYLNLSKYIEYAKKGETPHTSLMPQFFSLLQSLKIFDLDKFRAMVSLNAETLTKGLEKYIVNESISPVVTLRLNVKDALANEGFFVYQNETYMKDCIQISCFNYSSNHVYHELNTILRKIANG